MIKCDIKYQLYYSSDINLNEFEDEFENTDIELNKIDKLDKITFNGKGDFKLFLLTPAFLNDTKNTEVIEAQAKEESVIIYLEDDKANIPLNDKFVFTYISSLKPKKVLHKTMEKGFKSFVDKEKLHQLEKRLFLAEEDVQELQTIAIKMSTEKDIDKLLNLILRRCIDITTSDAGSLYLLDKDKDHNKILKFMLSQNFSLDIDSVTFTLPLNKKSIAGYVAVTKEILNIPDSYDLSDDAEYTHSKKFDKQYNYKTKSILTFPMINHKDEVIGVIQLINKRTAPFIELSKPEDFQKHVIPYNEVDERHVYSLASQAAVALENAILYDSIQRLFDGFVKASVQAIESRDPTTSGHSERVAIYSVELAKAVDRTVDGKFSEAKFSPEQIKELRYASLLHDFGKVGVRENVLTKAKKLYPDQLSLIIARINFIKKDLIAKYQAKKVQYLMANSNNQFEKAFAQIDEEMYCEINKLSHYMDDILRINEPAVLNNEDFGLLEEIKDYRFMDFSGNERLLLTDDEVLKLKVPKGSLDEHERLEIESHVSHTFQFLTRIPWTNEMKNLAEIAYGHHEKLDGSGYPRGLKEQQIPIQSKIMCIADIYDALTAHDRPYKKAVPEDRALKILGFEANDNHIDEHLLDIFIKKKIFASKIPQKLR